MILVEMMRIAASIYLNSAPLVYSFSEGSRSQTTRFLGDRAPARCAEMLKNGLCDVALIPVIEYQRIPDLLIIPHIAVAARRKVASVLLATQCPIEQVRQVALDSSSRTSQALLRILFKYRYTSKPSFFERTPDPDVNSQNMFEDSDAALIIGDPAMRLAASAGELGLRIYDLAEEWRELSALPFVFAVWATREDAVQRFPDLASIFLDAKAEGLKNVEKIVERYAHSLELPSADLHEYLTENVNFDLDEESIEGMRHFFRLARECGVIESERELEFC